MTDQELLEISAHWSYWSGQVREGLPRKIELPARLSDKLVLAIQGVRRCGKSTLLAQLIDRYALNPKHCAFLNFEDPRLGIAADYPLLEQWVRAFRAANAGVKRLYFFLDEVQAVAGWQKWLRTQLERPRGNCFVVTGSNAELLSGELSGQFTGRHVTVELFPFDWTEYQKARPRAKLLDFLTEGGFPAPLSVPEGDTLRLQYFADIVERDVRERVGARSAVPIKQVLQMAFESAGAELSLRRIAGAAGIAVETAASYLAACEAAYLLFACPYFAFSEKKRAARNQKYYPIDTGLRRMAVTRGGADRGKMLECAVYLELRRGGAQVSYWRGTGEVDFVVKSAKGFAPVQVSWDAPTERHQRALEEFYEVFPQAGEARFVGPEDLESGGLAEWLRS